MEDAAAVIYRGVVSHRRTHPMRHSFAYPIFMVLLDVDRVDELFRGWWPLAGVNHPAVASFRESDHMKLTRKPGQPLGEAVRDLMLERTGKRPAGKITLLTHLAYAGYCFNPLSLYYIYGEDAPDSVEAVVLEVSNTPWNEMHYYVAHPNCPDVVCSDAPLPASWRAAYSRANQDRSSQRMARPSPAPVGVETPANARSLEACGAVAPLDFEALSCLFEAAAEPYVVTGRPVQDADYAEPAASVTRGAAQTAVTEMQEPGALKPRRLRCDFSKSFHVSPFLPMDHTYSWVFTEPGETLLVQSENRRKSDGAAVFHTQLRLARQPALTWMRMAHLLLVAFPLLTLWIQLAIHYEAFRLWLKGAQLYDHPRGTTNAFTRTVEALFTPIAALVGFVARLWARFAPSS